MVSGDAKPAGQFGVVVPEPTGRQQPTRRGVHPDIGVDLREERVVLQQSAQTAPVMGESIVALVLE